MQVLRVGARRPSSRRCAWPRGLPRTRDRSHLSPRPRRRQRTRQSPSAVQHLQQPQGGAGLMSWFKIDDGFHCHPKVLEAGNEAIGLYVRCGSYCSQQLTEGRVPRVIALMYGDMNLIDTLVKVGLFKPVEDGWLIHDYGTYNPSREQVLAEREAAKQRQRAA